MPHRPELLRVLALLAVEERVRREAGDDHGVGGLED
jgi:hypothetical protein